MDFHFERTGPLAPRDRAAPGRVAARVRPTPTIAATTSCTSTRRRCRHPSHSPTYLAGRVGEAHDCGMVHPAKLAAELARVAEERGVEIFERSPVHAHRRRPARRRRGRHRRRARRRRARRARHERLPVAAEAQPAHDGAGVRLRAHDRAADATSSSPRSAGSDRQGIGDLANQFHYYRLIARQPDPVRRLRRGLPLRPQGARRSTRTVPSRSSSSRATSSRRSRSSRACASAHQWAGAIDTSHAVLRVLRHAPATAASPTPPASPGSASLRPASRARSCSTCSTGATTERTKLEMVRKRPLPFPPEPAAAIGINATRWSLDRADHNRGQAQPAAEDARRARPGVRLVSRLRPPVR